MFVVICTRTHLELEELREVRLAVHFAGETRVRAGSQRLLALGALKAAVWRSTNACESHCFGLTPLLTETHGERGRSNGHSER